MLDEELLRILACPVCVTPLSQVGDRLVCAACGRRYPIRDGIPVLLVDEAEHPPATGEGR
ncbi:MAG TPA: Trm112 family protein [Chloroflexota bacterium]|nr:Trm112 family protein [Chloroflexota bacterium]